MIARITIKETLDWFFVRQEAECGSARKYTSTCSETCAREIAAGWRAELGFAHYNFWQMVKDVLGRFRVVTVYAETGEPCGE